MWDWGRNDKADLFKLLLRPRPPYSFTAGQKHAPSGSSALTTQPIKKVFFLYTMIPYLHRLCSQAKSPPGAFFAPAEQAMSGWIEKSLT